jgi:hypothetical protein
MDLRVSSLSRLLEILKDLEDQGFIKVIYYGLENDLAAKQISLHITFAIDENAPDLSERISRALITQTDKPKIIRLEFTETSNITDTTNPANTPKQ